MMMMTLEFKNQPFPASAPPRGSLPRREYLLKKDGRSRPDQHQAAPLDFTMPR